MDTTVDPIDWVGSKSIVMLNPRTPEKVQKFLESTLLSVNAPEGLLWFATSGTTGNTKSQKWVGLSRGALLVSAQAVNHHLECDSGDTWLKTLPTFHVGGCGIYARAELVGGDVNELNTWSVPAFCEALIKSRATLTSLVPTQVFDIVNAKVSPPLSLRAVIVGGGVLSTILYQKAKALGWPLLPSYGLTECASQVATASIESLDKDGVPHLDILPHIHAKIDETGLLHLKSHSMLTCYAHITHEECQFDHFHKESWLITEDLADIEGNKLKHKGRGADFIKIGGESVFFSNLEALWQEIILESNPQADAVILPLPDERLGHAIHLFTTNEIELAEPTKIFNERVMPYERIRETHLVESIPRSPLGKVIRQTLYQELDRTNVLL